MHNSEAPFINDAKYISRLAHYCENMFDKIVSILLDFISNPHNPTSSMSKSSSTNFLTEAD